MNFALTEEQQLIRAGVREFCEKYVEPIAEEVDMLPRFPAENMKRLAEQDWCGIPYPAEYGGAGSDYLTLYHRFRGTLPRLRGNGVYPRMPDLACMLSSL